MFPAAEKIKYKAEITAYEEAKAAHPRAEAKREAMYAAHLPLFEARFEAEHEAAAYAEAFAEVVR